ncbi:MAG: patatin-like phospholipase family protein [Fibrobacterota bacterium]
MNFSDALAKTPFPFLSRAIMKKKIQPCVAVVLGGGFAKGVAQLGVLKVLEELEIKIDLLVGNSIGGLMAALYASRPIASECEKIALAFEWKNISDWGIPRRALFKGQKLEAFIRDALRKESFDDLSIPTAVITTDLRSGDEIVLCGRTLAATRKQPQKKTYYYHKVVFQEAPLVNSVRATCAVPGIFNPVDMGDRMLCDGLLCDNLPVGVAKMLGAEFVIAVDLSNDEGEVSLNNIVNIIVRAQSLQTRTLILPQARAADVLIRPDLRGISFTDFSEGPRFLERGRIAAQNAADEIVTKLRKRREGFPFGFFRGSSS